MTASRGCWRVEAQGAEPPLLANYDPSTDTWSLPEQGRLWQGVHLARLAGRSGAGRKIAVIDGSIDRTIPRLAERSRVFSVAGAADDEPTGHGTVVALLIAAVAPEAELEIYETFYLGVPHDESVRDALTAIRTSDADVVNLSIGLAKPYDTAFLHYDDPEGWDVEDARMRIDDDCDLCRLVNAVAADKLVIAAAGNDPSAVYCPARSGAVVATGFSVEQRTARPDGGEFALSVPPMTFPSSEWTDCTIQEVPGALGTSFAAPLLSGFSTLCAGVKDVPRFVHSGRLAALAESRHQWANGNDDELRAGMHAAFSRALSVNPHKHRVASGGRPCPECMFFSEDLYVNWGLALLEEGRRAQAQELLVAAVQYMPLSPHANANMGWLRYQDGIAAYRGQRLDEALDFARRSSTYLDRAIALEDSGSRRKLQAEVDGFVWMLEAAVTAIRRLPVLLHDRMAELGEVDASDAEILDHIRSLDPRIVHDDLRTRVREYLSRLATKPGPTQSATPDDIRTIVDTWRQ